MDPPVSDVLAVFDDLLKANEGFSASFDRGDVGMPPRRKVAIVTCMDARLHPETFLGLDVGDAHVIRNAGAAPPPTPSAPW